MGIRRLAEEERLSGAVVRGGLVYLAGQVADDASLDAEGQTADVLRADRRVAGRGRHRPARPAARVTVVLADIRDAPAMNRAWDALARPRPRSPPG